MALPVSVCVSAMLQDVQSSSVTGVRGSTVWYEVSEAECRDKVFFLPGCALVYVWYGAGVPPSSLSTPELIARGMVGYGEAPT